MITAKKTTKPNLFCFLHDGVQFGPCTPSELQLQVAERQLLSSDFVWQVGGKRRRAGTIGWLFPAAVNQQESAIDRQLRIDPKCTVVSLLSTEVVNCRTHQQEDTGTAAAQSSFVHVLGKCWEHLNVLRKSAHATLSNLDSSTLTIGLGCVLIVIVLLRGLFFSRFEDRNPNGLATDMVFGLGAAMSQLSGVERQLSEQQEEARKRKKTEEAEKRKTTEELLKKASVLVGSDMPHAARECLEQGLKLTPNHTASHIAMAELCISQGEHTSATDSLWKAVSSADGDIHTQLELLTRISADCFNAGDFHGSIKAMEYAIRLKPEEGAYRYTAGVASLNAGNAKHAIPYFEAALEYFRLAGQTGEWEFKALCQLAIAQRRLGATEKALELCERVIQRDPKNLDARCIRGLIYAEDNFPDQAVKDLQFIVTHPGCSLDTAIKFAEAFRRHKQWEPALMACRRACLLNRRNANLTYWRGMFSLLTGQYEEAAADARLAMQLEPEDEKLKTEIAQLSSTAETLISRGITLDQLIEEEVRAEEKFQELVNSRSSSSGASSGYSSGPSDYSGSYVTPRNAGKLGVLGIQVIPGQHAHHFGQ